VKNIFAATLMVILLVVSASALPDQVVATIEMSATGGAITQVATNVATVEGDGAVLSESISMTAIGSGAVAQDAQNIGIVEAGSDNSAVDQSVILAAQGSSVDQNMVTGNANIIAGEGDDASVEQSVTMTAVATDGPVNQVSFNTAGWTGDDVSISQTAELAGQATGGVVNQVGAHAAGVTGDDANIYQNTTANALATGDISQTFANAAIGDGVRPVYVQVIIAAANSTGSGSVQVGTNEANTGLFQFGVRANQSVIFAAMADGAAVQAGTNVVFAGDNASLGQEIAMSADAVDITQLGVNTASAGNNFGMNQAIAFDTISDEGTVTQGGTNLFTDLMTTGNTNSSLGQLISGASRGGDATTQVFTNVALLDHPAAGSLSYTVTQANIANATGLTAVTQVPVNQVDWESSADGMLAQMLHNRAQATTVLQTPVNILNPV